MPKYTPTAEDMDESYGGEVKPPADASPGKPESVDEENAGADTAIVSNKILSPDGEPLKEGDEIVVTVVKNYGDESEIKYAPKEGASAGPTDETMNAEAASEISALDQGGE